MVRHCLWKMCATTGACIKPGCAARRLLCRKVNLLSCVARRPLCKVNLPICEARRRHFIMTCDIFGTGHTNIIRKNQYKPAHGSATQARGGYSQKNWVGVCGPLPKTLTLFMTKICYFPYPIYDLTKNLLPHL